MPGVFRTGNTSRIPDAKIDSHLLRPENLIDSTTVQWEQLIDPPNAVRADVIGIGDTAGRVPVIVYYRLPTSASPEKVLAAVVDARNFPASFDTTAIIANEETGGYVLSGINAFDFARDSLAYGRGLGVR